MQTSMSLHAQSIMYILALVMLLFHVRNGIILVLLVFSDILAGLWDLDTSGFALPAIVSLFIFFVLEHLECAVNHSSNLEQRLRVRQEFAKFWLLSKESTHDFLPKLAESVATKACEVLVRCLWLSKFVFCLIQKEQKVYVFGIR